MYNVCMHLIEFTY